MTETIRTFIAIDLSEENQNKLALIQDKLKECPTCVRWVKPENIHLTLKFLGDISQNKIQKIIKLIPGIYKDAAPFAFDITHLGAFPKISRPNIIWVGIENNADKLRGLADKLEHGLVSLGFAKKPKKFSPHITIGRVKNFKGVKKFIEAIESIQIDPPLLQDDITISLYQSTLTSQGPVYTPLHRLTYLLHLEGEMSKKTL